MLQALFIGRVALLTKSVALFIRSVAPFIKIIKLAGTFIDTHRLGCKSGSINLHESLQKNNIHRPLMGITGAFDRITGACLIELMEHLTELLEHI